MNEPDATPDAALPPANLSGLDTHPQPLDIEEFLEPETSVAPVEDLPLKRPGPGLPEAILWCLGIGFVQLAVASVALSAWVIVEFVVHRRPPEATLDSVDQLGATLQLVLFGAPNAVAFVFLIGLAILRLRPQPWRKLNLSAPSVTQVLLLCGVVFPLGLLADAVWAPSVDAWEWIVQQVPFLQVLDGANVMEFMESMGGASFPLLLLCVAVVPAIGEEFMLRGLIGRGLVARWGVFSGVVLTSALFACLHIYPPHVASVFGLGIMMHIIYLTTRSFWAPVLFHFLNNGLASLYTALGLAATETVQEKPLWVTPLALGYVAVTIWALCHFRTRYVDAEGREYDPGYMTVERPRPELGLQRVAGHSLIVAGLAALLLVAQMTLIGIEVLKDSGNAPHPGAPQQPQDLDPLPGESRISGWRPPSRFDGITSPALQVRHESRLFAGDPEYVSLTPPTSGFARRP